MNSALVKITLLACLGVGSVGTASSAEPPDCPAMVAGKLTMAWQPPGGDGNWSVERRNPENWQQGITTWQRLAVNILDPTLKEDEALKKGQEILDSSWGYNAKAFEGDAGNGKVYYQCQYSVQKDLLGKGNWIGLNSYVPFPPSTGIAAQSSNQPIIMTKLH